MISQTLDRRLQLGVEIAGLLFLGWVTYIVWDTNPRGIAIVTAAGIFAGFLLIRYPPKRPVVNLLLVVAAFGVSLYLITPSTTEKFGDLGLSWLISVAVGIYLGTIILQRKRKLEREQTHERNPSDQTCS